jgi:hypothetical protein
VPRLAPAQALTVAQHFAPAEHLQKYSVLLGLVLRETADGNLNGDCLTGAMHALQNLQTSTQLSTFQASMDRGPPGNLQWFHLVLKHLHRNFPKAEAKRLW